MNMLRRQSRTIGLLLIFSLMFLAGPVHNAQAAMIGAQTVIDTAKAEKAKTQINAFLAREDVQNTLTSMGISPDEAIKRAQSLSDSEAIAFADNMEKAPAGGSGLGVVVGAALFVFIVLLITDILGFTKVFSFTKSVR
ncbi:PA2779 family protein [Seleniivibrio sp.]|uniref:PA2779 family protein n=1 Tax=Seleniivibrio sp. TaxID=2898801 RepID=UPI0025E8D898|nr:PA2779 family protein [Seleniivibrio sp.]MCD8553417.1 PA2779 family protein [Seleniivibrio sp.]